MFKAAHIARIQVYPLTEFLFEPEKFNTSNWQAVDSSPDGAGFWQRWRKRLPGLGHTERQQLFTSRRDTMEWIRDGKPLIVPNLGIMKPLRYPYSRRDRFYRPFYQVWEIPGAQNPMDREAEILSPEQGAMPFYPLQILLDPAHAELLENALIRELKDIVGPLPIYTIEPMLIVYPAGVISGQLRLFIEPKTEISAISLQSIVKKWD